MFLDIFSEFLDQKSFGYPDTEMAYIDTKNDHIWKETAFIQTIILGIQYPLVFVGRKFHLLWCQKPNYLRSFACPLHLLVHGNLATQKVMVDGWLSLSFSWAFWII